MARSLTVVPCGIASSYIDDGDLQTDNVMVAKHYLSTYFTLDVIATFPFSVFMDDVLAVRTVTILGLCLGCAWAAHTTTHFAHVQTDAQL